MIIRALFLYALLAAAPALANVVGADTQNFNPTNDGLDFVTVHSSETLNPGYINFGLFVNYAVNSLPNYENTTTQTRTDFADSLTSMDLNFAVGLMKNWEVGASAPILLAQEVESDIPAFHGEFYETGVTEYRIMTKYRLFGDHDHGLAAIVSANFNQIENNPFQGVEPGPTYNFEVAADTTFAERFAVGVNAGYRVRNPGDPILGVPVSPLGNQFIASAAVSYGIASWDSKIIAEVFGSVPTEENQFVSDRDDSSAEALLGLKHDFTESLAWHAGGGTQIFHGTSSPDWRVYTGLNFVIGPMFSKPREVIVKVKDQPLEALEEDIIEPVDPFEGVPQVVETFVTRDVLFDFNKDTLTPKAHEIMGRLAVYLKKPPGLESLVIDGHTDWVGSDAYNMDLSKRRALSVRAYLISQGVPATKIRAFGYGERRPIADNGNFQGRAANRRVEFKIRREGAPPERESSRSRVMNKRKMLSGSKRRAAQPVPLFNR